MSSETWSGPNERGCASRSSGERDITRPRRENAACDVIHEILWHVYSIFRRLQIFAQQEVQVVEAVAFDRK